MARSLKTTAVAEISEEFRSSSAALLTEYRGLTVAQLKELRRSLSGNASYAVVKNTLTKIAAQDAGISGLDEFLAGPSAIAFVKGDPVEAAKGIRDFAKTHPKLVIKGGYLDGKVLSAADVTKLADLESRDVLLAKLAGAMNASLQQAVSLFAAPLSKAARTIEALRLAAEEDPSKIGGAGSVAPAAASEAAAEVPEPVEAAASTSDVDSATAAPATAVEVSDVAAAASDEAPVAAEAPVATAAPVDTPVEAVAEPDATPVTQSAPAAPVEATTEAAAAVEENAEG
ncbi:MAG: 50S ribosomal protein L10 [Candidatus Nanopelagicales bacterium]